MQQEERKAAWKLPRRRKERRSDDHRAFDKAEKVEEPSALRTCSPEQLLQTRRGQEARPRFIVPEWS